MDFGEVLCEHRSDWLEAECAPGLKTPAPVQYDAENGKISRSKLPQHSASANIAECDPAEIELVNTFLQKFCPLVDP